MKHEICDHNQPIGGGRQNGAINLETLPFLRTALVSQAYKIEKVELAAGTVKESSYYNLQSCQEKLQVPVRPFHSSLRLDPLSIAFPTFGRW